MVVVGSPETVSVPDAKTTAGALFIATQRVIRNPAHFANRIRVTDIIPLLLVVILTVPPA
jgi:hypothetical protein